MEKTKLLEGTAPSINLSNWQEKKKRKGIKKNKRIRERKKKTCQATSINLSNWQEERKRKGNKKKKSTSSLK